MKLCIFGGCSRIILINIHPSGIAGIRTNSPNTECQGDESQSSRLSDGTTSQPITPSNTPQSPTSGRESPNREHDLQATVELISNLRLDNCDNVDGGVDDEE